MHICHRAPPPTRTTTRTDGLDPVADRKLGPISVLTTKSSTMATGGIVTPRDLTLHHQNPALTSGHLSRVFVSSRE